MIYQPNDRKIRLVHIEMQHLIAQLSKYTPRTRMQMEFDKLSRKSAAGMVDLSRRRKGGQP